MESAHEQLEGKLIIGIDLGTTKSGVAVWDEAQGKAVLVADENGDDIIPSVVAWDRDANDWLVGKPAKALLAERPWDVAFSVKRFIGRAFSDRAVSAERANVTYGLVGGAGSGELLSDVVVQFGRDAAGQQQLDVPAISAKVLGQLRRTAAAALGRPLEEVVHAVVTVPAYFNLLQRKATVRAGELAGLHVVDILNEPTAAALAHGDLLLKHGQRRVLVYDLGGGTFDISLLDVTSDPIGYLFDTVLIDGNTHLGGDDIDMAVSRHIAAEIERRYGHPVRSDDVLTRARIRLAAERAKILLTEADRTTIALERLELGSATPFDVSIELTREQLDACAASVLQRASSITERAIRTIAGLDWSQVDEIVLVGGQTRMPAVQRSVAELTGKTPIVSERPQTAVALGAATYGHILSRGREKFQQNALTNVIALALGIRTNEDTFRKIVDANAAVPHKSREFPVTTLRDDQTEIEVEVFQGPADATTVDQCIRLSSVRMEVPPAPARQFRYDVSFEVQSDGTVRVTVTDPRRRRSESLDIGERDIVVYKGESSAKPPT